MAEPRAKYYPWGGGLDVVTPALSVNPGRCLAMINYEPFFNGGYRRIFGFERFDGRPKPSAQTFVGFEVNAQEDIVIGSTVTGTTSGATGVVVAKSETTNVNGDRENDMIAVTKIGGTPPFVDGEELTGEVFTNADQQLRPDALVVDVLGPGSTMLDTDFTAINTGLADDTVDTRFLRTVKNLWPVGGQADFSLSDTLAGITSLNAWTLNVRARIRATGAATSRKPNKDIIATPPEINDLATWQFEFTPGGGDTQVVTFTEVDAEMGFVTRSATQAVAAATPAQVNAAVVELTQTLFTQVDEIADGLRIEISGIELVLDADGTATILSQPTAQDAPTDTLEDTWRLAAQDDYRADIAVVPGAGPVNFAWQLGSAEYAVRNNVGNTEGVLHTASAAGWTTAGITMAPYLFFTLGGGGAANPLAQEGDVITGTISGATATVHRVILHSGATATNDAAGYYVLTGQLGVFQAETIEFPAATVIATIAGDSVPFTFPIDGFYEAVNHNFFAGAGTLRAYGVNGVGPGFEIDENGVVSPIILPSVAPTAGEVIPLGAPFLIEEHKNHLFHAYPGGRFVQSVVGLPLTFNGFLGAAEFGAGDEITGMESVVGTVLAVSTERETRGLFGNNILDWNLKLLSEKTGGKLYSMQKVDTVYTLDDLGITSLSRTDAFGDFIGSTISQLIQPLVNNAKLRFTDSTIVRNSNQYRLYFNDGTAFVMYIPATGSANRDRQTTDITRTGVQFGFLNYPFQVSRIWNTEDGDGTERTFFTTTDPAGEGFVFEDQIGENFDGETIESWVRTAYNLMNTPSYRKHFRRADLELVAERPLSLIFIADFSFGDSDSQNSQDNIDIMSGGGFWSIDNWDEFFWDGNAISTAKAQIVGGGENLSFLVFNDSATAAPFVLQGVTITYEQRRLQR